MCIRDRYAEETDALMEHLRRFVAPEPVLANFGISAAIATYGGCPVVLHPKFETPEIRRKVQEYGEALFLGDEDEFRGWMEAQGATVYVHSMGEFATIQPGLQMRYMVNALEPATNAAARLFEQRPEELQHFQAQFANRKYRVFRLKNSTVAAAAYPNERMSSGWNRLTASLKLAHRQVSSYSGRQALGLVETAIRSSVHMGTRKNKMSHNMPGLSSP